MRFPTEVASGTMNFIVRELRLLGFITLVMKNMLTVREKDGFPRK
ncbi:hypothetical protein [Paenibacillus sp. Soil724D2]|nr:hypothetical protein [Paenibacillus sp. Soil724D2]